MLNVLVPFMPVWVLSRYSGFLATRPMSAGVGSSQSVFRISVDASANTPKKRQALMDEGVRSKTAAEPFRSAHATSGNLELEVTDDGWSNQ